MRKWSFIILAAGRGTRLESAVPKPLVKINGVPLIEPILTKATCLTPDRVFVVISQFTEQVRTQYPSSAAYVVAEPLGTGHAAAEALKHIATSHVIIAQADDSFFYSIKSLKLLMAVHRKPLTIAVAPTTDPMLYSSVNSNNGRFVSLNYDRQLPAPKDVFCGLYAAQASWLRKAIASLTPTPKGELELPGVLSIAKANGLTIGVLKLPEHEWCGVNTVEELTRAESLARLHQPDVTWSSEE